MAELFELTAAQLARRIAAHELSPVEVVRAALERIERLQPDLNCFITVCGDQAMAAAREAEQAVMRGDRLGPLHGVPYHAKDLVSTRGVRTTFGSLVHKDNVPQHDAVANARMRAAGAILVGKTTTPEFGHKGLTDAPLFGRTRNAWSAARTSGGSSGGAAVAIAAGLCPIGIATDGGGSTRIPAACNGVVGFKQNLGTVPHSEVADSFGAYTYVTPMTRTVMDTALMLDAMAGEDASDPWSMAVPRQDYIAAARRIGTLKGKRIRYALKLGNQVVAADVRTAFEAVLKRLEELGAELEELTGALPDMYPIWRVINHTTWRARFGDMIAKHRDQVSPSLIRQVEQAADWSGADLLQASFARTAIYRQVQAWLADADFLVTPTLSRTALTIEQDLFEPIEIDNAVIGELRQSWFPYTMPFNLTGHPATSVLCGFAGDGLPIGLQLVGRFRDDAAVLRTAALYEASESWLERRPQI
jgi:aspartyl-tRNA(Asn)/glutamyl-tRNA(Gln) amidotransferase subunit A